VTKCQSELFGFGAGDNHAPHPQLCA
jgi:hypothetical protein